MSVVTKVNKSLLCVELYEISNNFIYKLRNKQNRVENVFNLLPKYTINSNKNANNRLIVASDHHQWVGIIEDEYYEKYLYFNLITLDSNLNEEFNSIGEEELFKDLDFKRILSNFTPESEDNITNFSFSRANYLIVSITYITTHDNRNGEYETDSEVNITGYLDDKFNLIIF